MKQNIIKNNHQEILEIVSDKIEINNLQDALDLMGNAYNLGINNIIIREEQLNPDFFDLNSGLAGNILQKLSNYQMKIAIIGNFKKYKSKSLDALILECNRRKQTFFVPDIKTATQRLTE